MKRHLLNGHPKDFIKQKTQFKCIKGGVSGGKNKYKKWHAFYTLTITEYFDGHQSYKKVNPLQLKFTREFILYIVKMYEVFPLLNLHGSIDL